MNILGLAGLLIDGASCLIKDNKLVAAVEEERYTRIKHASMVQANGLPYGSIKACLKAANISWKDIDHVGYYFEPWREFFCLSRFRLRHSYLSPLTVAYYQVYYLDNLRRHLMVPRLIRLNCGKDVKFHWFGHHLCHAASAYYTSAFEQSAILVIDAMSEIECTSFYKAKGNKIDKILSYNFPHSLGFFYAIMTDYLGFRSNNDEYKVMGLASLGKPVYFEQLKDVVRIRANGEIRLNFSYFDRFFRGKDYVNQKFYSQFGPKRDSAGPLTERHADFAASLQKLLEESVFKMLNHLHQITKLDNLCLAGGVALNCTLNGKLLKAGPFKNVFVQPACHDAGGALGAALLIKHQVLNVEQREQLLSPYLGEEFSNQQIKAQLDQSKIAYQYFEDITTKAAQLLASGNIIAWFQGRAEWGPRALGNRSILADPTRAEMKDLINIRVKHREEFRPFAPSVTLEDAGKFFEGIEHSPFMLFAVRAKENAKEKIPAVVHVDQTSRLQTVSKQANPRYHQLLKAFEKIKGVPVLLNTSFNVNNEPIANSPEEAIRCFYSTGIDHLVIGNYLVSKQPEQN
ncbi:carbamoyltransferase [Candidatus Omnitrophota bacterium]